MTFLDKLDDLFRQLRISFPKSAANVECARATEHRSDKRNAGEVIRSGHFRQLESKTWMRKAKQRRNEKIHVAPMARSEHDQIAFLRVSDRRLYLRFTERDLDFSRTQNFSEEIRKRSRSPVSLRLFDRPADVGAMHSERCFTGISLEQMLRYSV